jgi:hypothetical protein
LGVYRFKETTKKEFVPNAIEVEMQHHHFYIVHHTTRVVIAPATYQTKHMIININMV